MPHGQNIKFLIEYVKMHLLKLRNSFATAKKIGSALKINQLTFYYSGNETRQERVTNFGSIAPFFKLEWYGSHLDYNIIIGCSLFSTHIKKNHLHKWLTKLLILKITTLYIFHSIKILKLIQITI